MSAMRFFTLLIERLGALPLINQFIARMGLDEALARHVPSVQNLVFAATGPAADWLVGIDASLRPWRSSSPFALCGQSSSSTDRSAPARTL
jgi:hypothetical protein